MDVVMIILRLLHILGGVVWVGTVFAMVLFVYPAIRAAGPLGDQFARALGQQTKIGIILPLATVLTLLSGLMMYGRDSGGFRPDWIATPEGTVLSIGALAALIAFFGPSLLLARVQRRLGAFGQELAQAGGAPSADQRAELVRLQGRVRRLNWTIFVLLAIAVTCMATFRYV